MQEPSLQYALQLTLLSSQRPGRFGVTYASNQVIVGNYAPVPEPASYAMLPAAGVAMGVVLRRRGESS